MGTLVIHKWFKKQKRKKKSQNTLLKSLKFKEKFKENPEVYSARQLSKVKRFVKIVNV